MKNNKTMYLLAKARAVKAGPRKFTRFVGYALTETEIKRIFILEGFSPKKKTMADYLDLWQEAGFVKCFNVGENGEKVFFFLLDALEQDDASLLKKIELTYPNTNATADVGVMFV